MNVSGFSASFAINAAMPAVAMHASGCCCASCQAQQLGTSTPSLDLQKSGQGRSKSTELSTEQQAQVSKLQARDREVRQHEQAHLIAGGGLVTGGPSYQFQRGPDGQNYAIGGEVQIDTSRGSDAEETLRRASQIERAALAPKDPSSADMAVAAKARQMAQTARLELAYQSREQDQAQLQTYV